MFGANAVNIVGLTTLNTVGGNITTVGAGTVDAISTNNIVVVTKTGNMTENGGGQFSLATSGFSFTGSPTASTVNVTSNMPNNIPLLLNTLTANNADITSTTTDVNIAGKVAATNVIDISSTTGSIFQAGTNASLSGQNITLNANTSIGIANSTAGLATKFTGAAPTLNINAGQDANITSATLVNLGTSTIGRNLTINTKAGINQSGILTVTGSSFITAATFTQLANSTFTGTITDFNLLSAKNSAVVGGTLIATTSLSLVTPANGHTGTVNAGGIIDSPNSSFAVGSPGHPRASNRRA